MSVINKIASALNRNDEEPNVKLAIQIVNEHNKDSVKVLVDNLFNKNKGIQNDCIKVLYEIGDRDSSLLIDYLDEFLTLLDSKNNRLQWGVMTALNSVTLSIPALINSALPKIISAGDKGSVITKDQVVNILIKLCSIEEYEENAYNLLIEQLIKSPTNQLPMYAERAMPIIKEENKQLFVEILTSRLDEIEKESKRKRVEKVIKKISDK
ncbi:hypothetical protein [Bacillus sp. EAC]|uniref:hypothetical protein n=1 Tax=Bacillus sp. EAC TaxID=1978338 RepID=UPI000B450041|nr:hypothetical protein [Bacillus sp. EAC]